MNLCIDADAALNQLKQDYSTKDLKYQASKNHQGRRRDTLRCQAASPIGKPLRAASRSRLCRPAARTQAMMRAEDPSRERCVALTSTAQRRANHGESDRNTVVTNQLCRPRYELTQDCRTQTARRLGAATKAGFRRPFVRIPQQLARHHEPIDFDDRGSTVTVVIPDAATARNCAEFLLDRADSIAGDRPRPPSC